MLTWIQNLFIKLIVISISFCLIYFIKKLNHCSVCRVAVSYGIELVQVIPQVSI